jgi:hypothetical protein
MSLKLGKILITGCTAVVLALGAASPALAIKYVGVFDPIFDGGISNGDYEGIFGYRGQATFDVDDICLTGQSSAHLVVNGETFETRNGNAYCAISVIAASLTIYQNTEDGDQTTHSMLTSSAPPEVYGIVVKNGTLDGVVTNYFGGVYFGLTGFDDGANFSEFLYMRFFDDRVTFNPYGNLEFSQTGNDPVDLCTGSVETDPVTREPICNGDRSNRSATTTFTAVPEPASLGLAAAALAACVLSRRRVRAIPRR